VVPPTNSVWQLGNPRTTTEGVLGVLTLPDGTSFKTTLYNMRVIGQLRTTKKLVYFIPAGTTCTGWDENTSIYIHSPSDGAMKNEGEQPRFSYPGQETDYQSGKLDHESRMFYGDCLRSHPNALVWFDKRGVMIRNGMTVCSSRDVKR
jgi:hypothetical protein